jgi:nitroreductase
MPATQSAVAEVVRHAAERATLAPSVHNTQPWRVALHEDSFDLFADPSRRLKVLDPRGRQLTISCGCALFNARVAIAAAGFEPIVQRRPDAERPDLLARVGVGEPRTWVPIAGLNDAVDQRRTNRRAYAAEEMPAAVIDALSAAAEAEGVVLLPILKPELRVATAQLGRLADRIENADPAYRAEIRQWTTDDPRRRDGVEAASVPYLEDRASAGTDALPIRAFDARHMGWLPESSRSDANQCLLLFTAAEDEPLQWLRTGEALERVWLELTRKGYWASPLTQVVEVQQTNGQLRKALDIAGHPQILLRAGRAPFVPSTHRRPLEEVLVSS